MNYRVYDAEGNFITNAATQENDPVAALQIIRKAIFNAASVEKSMTPTEPPNIDDGFVESIAPSSYLAHPKSES